MPRRRWWVQQSRRRRLGGGGRVCGTLVFTGAPSPPACRGRVTVAYDWGSVVHRAPVPLINLRRPHGSVAHATVPKTSERPVRPRRPSQTLDRLGVALQHDCGYALLPHARVRHPPPFRGAFVPRWRANFPQPDTKRPQWRGEQPVVHWAHELPVLQYRAASSNLHRTAVSQLVCVFVCSRVATTLWAPPRSVVDAHASCK